jgi:hypothetical protein
VSVARDVEADIVISAIVGAAGLLPTMAAIERGRTIALANKETLVMAGSLMTAAARARGVALLPVDSEHSAVFQCLAGHNRTEVHRVLLTASGGPFRELPKAALASVTVDDALRHPTWKMGAKITIDSATLMNKGLEVIEARWLFDLTPEQVHVIVHPQSIVHSMVEYLDGSVIAQLGVADMGVPILYALTSPERRPHLLPARRGQVPVSAAGAGGARGRWTRARRAQRRERGGRRRVPRPSHRLHRHFRTDRPRARRAWRWRARLDRSVRRRRRRDARARPRLGAVWRVVT